jgi:hypothetical protein
MALMQVAAGDMAAGQLPWTANPGKAADGDILHEVLQARAGDRLRDVRHRAIFAAETRPRPHR